MLPSETGPSEMRALLGVLREASDAAPGQSTCHASSLNECRRPPAARGRVGGRHPGHWLTKTSPALMLAIGVTTVVAAEYWMNRTLPSPRSQLAPPVWRLQ